MKHFFETFFCNDIRKRTKNQGNQVLQAKQKTSKTHLTY